MNDDSGIPSRADRVIATVGGPVDELRATLALYGDDLEPVGRIHRLHALLEFDIYANLEDALEAPEPSG